MTFDLICVLSTFIEVADELLERLHHDMIKLTKSFEDESEMLICNVTKKKSPLACVHIACYFTGRHFSPPNYHDIICEK